MFTFMQENQIYPFPLSGFVQTLQTKAGKITLKNRQLVREKTGFLRKKVTFIVVTNI